MLTERGVSVYHSTIYRWVQGYAPKILDKLKWYWKPSLGYSWRVDETYVKVKGKWVYLYRAVDSSGNTIDFYLSRTRNANAASVFLVKPLNPYQTIHTQAILILIRIQLMVKQLKN